jgi:TonB family protein
MLGSIDAVLDDRRRRSEPGRLAGRLAAAALHAVAIAAVILAPKLRAAPPQLPEFVAVQIIPAQRLGIPEPPPAPPPKPQPQAPEPEAAPPPPEAAPAPDPPPVVPRPAPVAPSPPPPAPRPAAASAPVTPEAAAAPAVREGSPLGSRDGAVTGAAVAGLDNPDFTYGYYVDQMLGLIRAQWVRPTLGGGIEASVHFVIARDGRVSEARIVSSSGYSSFDLSGLRAVQAASPLPPLPKGYRQSALGVTLIIR